MEGLKKMLQSPLIIVILFTIKLVVYYSLIKANMDIIFILISTIGFGSIFYGLCFCNLKRKKGLFLIVYSLLTVLMFADSMYYNYYNQTVSIKQLWQAANVAAVPDSFVATLIPASFLLFLDIPFIYVLFKKYTIEKAIKHNWKVRKEFRYIIVGLSAAFIVLVVNPFHSVAIDKVNSVEFFTNHVNDIYNAISENIAVEEVPVEEVLEVVDEVTNDPKGTTLKGIGEGKNLIVIQVEALQNFVIGAQYNDQELTPNLNALLRKDTLYFDNYYSNIGKGNTADAEFSTLNSLYPVIDRECYTLYQDNTFNGLPWLLRDKGYSAFAIHGYKGEFWNREVAYPGQGFENFYSMEDLDATETIGLGVSDKSMFKQAVHIMENKKNPFFSFIITLTSHHPYIIDEAHASLTLKEEDKESKFGAYLQTIHYTDQAIGEFVQGLKAVGLYDNTVIAIYGDHHALNVNMDNNKEIMSNYLGKNYDYDEMLNVPLIIHVPDSDVTKTISTIGGQIDFLPTIANIMGLEISQPYVLGQDLVNAKEGFVAFTSYLFDGSFVHNDVMFEISREGVFDGSRAWNIKTGEPLDASLYEEDYNRAVALKKSSKEILEQDLIADYISRNTTEENSSELGSTKEDTVQQNSVEDNSTIETQDQSSQEDNTKEDDSKENDKN